jgi:hypothetical protein
MVAELVWRGCACEGSTAAGRAACSDSVRGMPRGEPPRACNPSEPVLVRLGTPPLHVGRRGLRQLSRRSARRALHGWKREGLSDVSHGGLLATRPRRYRGARLVQLPARGRTSRRAVRELPRRDAERRSDVHALARRTKRCAPSIRPSHEYDLRLMPRDAARRSIRCAKGRWHMRRVSCRRCLRPGTAVRSRARRQVLAHRSTCARSLRELS